MDPHADRLAHGAVPVLVEGPIDAIAVSLACPDHVGVAPLGTALTDTQADILTREHPAKLVVATDPDGAGHLAAERDYWILAARGADPQHAALPRGLDPADVLRTAGPAALRRHLEQAGPLANALVNERLAHLPAAEALAEALAVVAAGDADRWRSRTTVIARRLHVLVEVALTQLIPMVAAWDRDRAGQSGPRIHDNATGSPVNPPSARLRGGRPWRGRSTRRWSAPTTGAHSPPPSSGPTALEWTCKPCCRAWSPQGPWRPSIPPLICDTGSTRTSTRTTPRYRERARGSRHRAAVGLSHRPNRRTSGRPPATTHLAAEPSAGHKPYVIAPRV